MQKIVLFFLLVLTGSLAASAQITKGSILLGGGVSFGNNKSEAENNYEAKQTGYYVGLSAGIAIKENTVVGGSISYGQTNQKRKTGGNTFTPYENTTYGAGVFLRKYLPLGKNFYLFGQGGLNYNHNNQFQLSNNTEQRIETNGWNVGLSVAPGLSYALTKKFHLELGFNELAGISYGRSKTNNTFLGGTSTSHNSAFGFTTSLGTSTPLNIGFRVLLAK